MVTQTPHQLRLAIELTPEPAVSHADFWARLTSPILDAVAFYGARRIPGTEDGTGGAVIYFTHNTEAGHEFWHIAIDVAPRLGWPGEWCEGCE